MIYLGWIHASHGKGYFKVAKRFSVCAVCGGGLCDTGTLVSEVRKATFIPEDISLFTLQGGIEQRKGPQQPAGRIAFPYTEQNASDYIASMLSSDEDSTFAYAITQNDRTIGSIGAFRQGNIHRQTAELGYYLAEEYWGRGIMTDAIRQLCGIVFDTTDILRIYAEPFAYNTGERMNTEKRKNLSLICD